MIEQCGGAMTKFLADNKVIAYDNGGAFSIKGYNFQTAAIILVIINNYQKKGFHIFVESKDDAQVFIEGKQTNVQMKSTKLSVKKLIDEKNEILKKNLNSGDENAWYKIFTKNNFSQSDLKKMKIHNGKVFEGIKIYEYSQEQKEEIMNRLSDDVDMLESKIENSYIVISPFEDNLGTAYNYLSGLLTTKGYDTSGDRWRITLNELFLLIQQKSEYVVSEESDFIKKRINQDDLHSILRVNKEREYFDQLSSELYPNNIRKLRAIDKAQAEILVKWKQESLACRDYIVNDIISDSNNDITTPNLVKTLIIQCDEIPIFKLLNHSVKEAIVLEIIAERLLKYETNDI